MKTGHDLDALLGYAIRRAEVTMLGDARRALEPFGLTPARLTALLLIRNNPGCDQTALGRALSINRSSAMKLVNLLAERGLIERRAGRNLRTNALHMTSDGEAAIDAMLDAIGESDRRMSARLTEAERRSLFTLLHKLGAPRASRTHGGSRTES